MQYNQNTIAWWKNSCIFPFPKKGDPGIVKNYLISIVAKIYNVLQLNRVEPEIEKILRKKTKWLS